jgi:hypothetical protein
VGFYDAMRGSIVLVVLGITAAVAYSVGRQNAPTISQSLVLTAPSGPGFSKPVAFVTAAVEPTATPSPVPALAPATSPPASSSSAKPSLPNRPASDAKRKVEVALTAAAIAAIIVQASRDQYHAGGRPCACPDDTMRNGRACGGRSAYSRPGGAAPLCYPTDVTTAMIESYKARQASR